MTSKFPLYLLLSIASIMAMASCNNETKEEVELSGNFSNCTVSSFNIVKNDSVLANLDSVFFSINLPKGEIYNADSLPVGTKVDKLLVKISTTSLKGCDLTFRLPGTDRDTTISHIDSPNDSINFADGPVKLTVTAYDGISTYDYFIKVNVHTEKPDTLYWAEAARRELPTSLSPSVQKTVTFGDKVYCMASDGYSATLAVSSDLFNYDWTLSEATLPSGALIESFSASSEAFYITDSEGVLYTSADAYNWTSTGERMNHIYGAYGNLILGARLDSDGWKQLSYPGSASAPLPPGCPVSGTSELVTYETKWSDSALTIMVGGRDADGNIIGSAWGYDGTKWSQVSIRNLDPTEGMSLFPYTTPRVSTTNWSVSERPALIALGGRYEEDGETKTSKTVYISYDQGLTWAEASSYLQFPNDYIGFYGAQAIVIPTTLSVSRSQADGWVGLPVRKLPPFATPLPPSTSRVSQAIDEWDCPYIYLFGGYDENNYLRNQVWRGVIRRFTFQPLY